MNRRPGRTERAVRELFAREPDLAFTLRELAAHCYPGARPVERRHLVATARAAAKVVARDPDWTGCRVARAGRPRLFYNRASVHSDCLASLMSDERARRLWDGFVARLRTREEMVALLAPGGERHDLLAKRRWIVEAHVAKRDGDAARAAAIEAGPRGSTARTAPPAGGAFSRR